MKNFLNWVRTHKLVTLLIVVVIFLGAKNFRGNYYGGGIVNLALPQKTANYYSESSAGVAGPMAMDMVASAGRSMIHPPSPGYGESTDLSVADRKVTTDTNFSLLVDDVASSIRGLKTEAETVGGFMVNSSINRPEEGGTGTLVVRVPSDRLDEYLEKVRGASVRVVSENVMGTDVTDQYTDVEARLETLNRTKGIYENMLSEATNVDEILRIQQAIFNVQDQIDRLQGQLQYLSNTTRSSLVTMYLSTDELALPYAPAEPWRPEVVFKTAVRSLVANLRDIASMGIWVVVYSPVFLVILIVFLVGRKMMRRNS